MGKEGRATPREHAETEVLFKKYAARIHDRCRAGLGGVGGKVRNWDAPESSYAMV